MYLSTFQPGKIGNPWAPIVDGPIVGVNYAFLPDPPAELRRQLQQMNVPLLAGIVRDEGAYFIRKCLTFANPANHFKMN